MFNLNMLVAAILAVITSLAMGFYSGYDWHKTKAEAAKAEMMALHQARVEQEQARGNALADKLAKAEGRITVKTIEMIKHVKDVTTGRDCLGPAAVGLLQPGNSQGLRATAGEPDAESPGASATDTDIGVWIAEANQYYDTCAARQHALIDWAEESKGEKP